MNKNLIIYTLMIIITAGLASALPCSWAGTIAVNGNAVNGSILVPYDNATMAEVEDYTNPSYGSSGIPLGFYSLDVNENSSYVYFMFNLLVADQEPSAWIAGELYGATLPAVNLTFTDADNDTYSVAYPGYPGTDKDCDDSNASINPGADEICDNGVDDDCDGDIDINDTECYCIDNDGDGYGENNHPDCTYEGIDCDDSDNQTNPGATEVCDGVDNNCDDGTYEGCNLLNGYCVDEGCDNDGDDYCDDDMIIVVGSDLSGTCDETDTTNTSTIEATDDCNDELKGVNPDATETCAYGADDNCDGVNDPNEIDNDDDGFTECEGDCNDGDDQYFPDAPTESCGTDMNCDGKERSCSSGSGGCTREYANCTEWTDCSENSSQTRDCYDIRGCTTYPQTETHVCEYVPPEPEPDSGSSGAIAVNQSGGTGINNTPDAVVNETPEDEDGNLLTSRVIGEDRIKPKAWMVMLAILLIGTLIAGIYFIFFRNDEDTFP